MDFELIPVKFEKVLQSKAYTCVVLSTAEKKFAIYTDPVSGKAMQHYLTEAETTRPFTHDLMHRIFMGFGISVRQVVINDLQDTLYFARIFLEQKTEDLLHIVEIDARPSDCITLALMHKIPVYCTKEVLAKTVAMIEE